VIVGRPVDYLASPLYVNDYHCDVEDDLQYEDEAQPKQVGDELPVKVMS